MLELKNITKTFHPGTVNEKKALCGIDLMVEDGDFITILGSNGAGKSTLFNTISGSIEADTGKILLDGKDVTYVPEYVRSRNIGRLFQDPLKGTAPHMTIAENLSLAYQRANKKHTLFSRITKQDLEIFQEKLHELDMGLEDRMDTPVGTLSGGQRQALTLLMATIVPPSVLLLDEHTAALDPNAAEKILMLTKEIVGRNHTTCLMITHNLTHSLKCGNRVLMMNGGKIVQDISGEEKQALTMDNLLEKFREGTQQQLDNDRMLFEE